MGFVQISNVEINSLLLPLKMQVYPSEMPDNLQYFEIQDLEFSDLI